MFISVDTKKAFDKIQHPFMIKTLTKAGIEGNFLNKVKDIYEKLTANTILSDRILKAFPVRSGTNKDALFDHFYSVLH